LTSTSEFDISTFIESLEYRVTPALVIRALGALAQEHRLAAYRLLVQAGAGGIPAGALAERLGVPPSSMSFHLAQLANAGLVTQRRESRSIIYSADYAAMSALMGYLTENCCGGASCDDAAPCEPAPQRKSA
jgi:DNA-binding transcriptional ArsR family regulator